VRSHQKKLIAISGCSGGGKSTLLAELKNNGYTVFPEVGREVVKEQLKIKGDILLGKTQNSSAKAPFEDPCLLIRPQRR